jgi:hypothetical protein
MCQWICSCLCFWNKKKHKKKKVRNFSGAKYQKQKELKEELVDQKRNQLITNFDNKEQKQTLVPESQQKVLNDIEEQQTEQSFCGQRPQPQ